MHIIIGLIMIISGIFITIKSSKILDMFGRISFFERYLGTEGGSRLGYKLIGIFIAFIGMLVMTNMIGGFLEWVLAPLLKHTRV